MEYIDIADTGVRPSRVGLGAWAIGGWMWGGTEEKEAIATIHSAIDRGITFVDTAAVYGFGNSEEIVAKALAGGRRAKAVIASKTAPEWTDDVEGAMGFTIDRATLDEIDRILARTIHDPVDPEFMAPPTRSVA
jgi:aryl-alcohol dehydrogenase-like predicted oxidoreductase